MFSTDLLFPRLFSADPNAKSDLDEDDAVELNAFTRLESESPAAFAAKVFDYVFRRVLSTTHWSPYDRVGAARAVP